MGSAREVAIFKMLLKTRNRSHCFSTSCTFHVALGSIFPAFLLLKSFKTQSNTQKGKDLKIGKGL